jgi:hypothetical protein
MMSLPMPTKWLTILLAIQLLGAQTPVVINIDLKPKTAEAFDRYVQLTEARINGEVSQTEKFLYLDELPEPRRSDVLAALKRGEIFMEQLQTRDASGHTMEAPEAIIHHWLGTVFVPGANLQQTIALAQDYNHHQDIYKPEVVRSRLIGHTGNDFQIYYRLRKKKVITITLNTYHDVHYFPIDSTRWYSRSYSTKIAEVANADTPKEREMPGGQDGGFLWRLNSYWKFEEKDGGVYIECESISLTRGIPTGLGWLIKPFVTSIPKESLEMTMGSTRAALAAGRGNRE